MIAETLGLLKECIIRLPKPLLMDHLLNRDGLKELPSILTISFLTSESTLDIFTHLASRLGVDARAYFTEVGAVGLISNLITSSNFGERESRAANSALRVLLLSDLETILPKLSADVALKDKLGELSVRDPDFRYLSDVLSGSDPLATKVRLRHGGSGAWGRGKESDSSPLSLSLTYVDWQVLHADWLELGGLQRSVMLSKWFSP